MIELQNDCTKFYFQIYRHFVSPECLLVFLLYECWATPVNKDVHHQLNKTSKAQQSNLLIISLRSPSSSLQIRYLSSRNIDSSAIGDPSLGAGRPLGDRDLSGQSVIPHANDSQSGEITHDQPTVVVLMSGGG